MVLPEAFAEPARTRRVAARGLAVRVAAAAAGAVALAALRLPGRPATLCPLRALTGVPCPFCGGTTAAVHIGHFDLLGALAANPLVVIGAAVVVTMPITRITARWHKIPNRHRIALGIATVAVAEIWQLTRFGLIAL